MPSPLPRRTGTGRRAQWPLVVALAALAVLVSTFRPATARAHPGHDRSGEHAALQADFAEQLAGAPAERGSSCSATIDFPDLGAGCRTDDGMLRLELGGGVTTTTHGPDYVAVTGDADPAELPPRTMAAVEHATVADVVCAPATSPRFQLTYAVPSDGIDHYTERADQLRQSVYELSAVIDNESRSLRPTASRRLPVACDADDVPTVDHVRLPTRRAQASVSSAFSELLAAAGDAVFQGSTHRLVFYDDDLGAFSGIADSFPDARAGAVNDNLAGGMVALQDSSDGTGPSWQVLLHEASHTMGAVNAAAPGSSGRGHCNDGLDVMCYDDAGPGQPSTYDASRCAQLQFDCGHDTYFHPQPTSGYLASNWNVGSTVNAYLSSSTVAADTTAPTTPSNVAWSMVATDVARLTWSASTDTGSGLHGYRVHERQGGGPWAVVGDVAQGTTTLDIKLPAGQTTALAVSAYDERGNESALATSSVVTAGPASSTQPVIPGPAPAAPTDFVATTRTTSSITFGWTRPRTAGHDGRLKLCLIPTGGGFSCSTFSGYGTFTWPGLDASSTYSFRLSALDDAGRESAATALTAATAPGAAPAPGTDVTAPEPPAAVTVDPSSDRPAPSIAWSGAGADATTFAVYHETSPGSGVWSSDVQVTHASQAVVRGMGSGSAPQRIGVAARDESGNESDITTVSHVTGTAPDTTAPTMPGVLSFGAVSDASLSLTWGAASDDVGVVGYRVLVSLGDRSQYQVKAAPAAPAATVTGLLPRTGYRVVVLAVDAVGNTDGSSTYVISTAADTTRPTAPTGLQVTGRTDTTVDLSWTAATDNSGSVAAYRVYRTAPFLAAPIAQVTGTSASLTGLVGNTAYTFAVESVDPSNNVSSARASITTSTIPDLTPPTSPGPVTVGAVSATTVALGWAGATDDVGVTEYRVYRTSPGPELRLQSLGPAARSTTLTGLADATAYTFTVEARDASGKFTRATAMATTPDGTAPSTPTSITATANTTGTSLTLGWTASTDAVGVTGYEIEQVGVGVVGTTDGATRTLDVTGLAEATSYTFTVVALDAAANRSTAGTGIVRTADVSAPSVVTNVRATATSLTSIGVAWDAATDNTGVASYGIRARAGGAFGPAVSVPGTSRAATITGLIPGTTYDVEVVAVDLAGNRSAAPLPLLTAATAAVDTVAPEAPSALTLGVVEPSGEVTVAWPAARDDVGVVVYRVYVGAGAGATLDVETPLRTRTIVGLARATTHTVSVTALDAAGNESPAVVSTVLVPAVATAPVAPAPTPPGPTTPEPPVPTTPAPATTDPVAATPAPAAPGTPLGLTATVTATTLRAAWRAPSGGAVSYVVTVQPSTGPATTRATTGTSIDLRPFAPRTLLTVRVVATTAAGSSTPAVLTVTTLADTLRPTLPTKLTALAKPRATATVTWLPAVDDVRVARYELLVAARGRTPVTRRLPAAARATTVTKLRRGVTYRIQLRAVDTAGNASGWTAVNVRTR